MMLYVGNYETQLYYTYAKKSVKIQIVTDSYFIDQNRRVMSFFKAIEMMFTKID